MNIAELDIKEKELYSVVMHFYRQNPIVSPEGQSKVTDGKLEIVFDLYRDVHAHYADLADKEDEALKRGLFIQWYAWTEPNWLTGIGLLDDVAMTKIIIVLNEKIISNTLDPELRWMLNYYVNPAWDFVFDKFRQYKGLDNVIKNCTEDGLPKSIDRTSMQIRGQMGLYWNSRLSEN
jgi:hypothetical protein